MTDENFSDNDFEESYEDSDSSKDDLLGYYDLEEIYDYELALIPINTREGNFIRENNLDPKDRRSYREDRMPQRVFKKISQLNKDKENIQVRKLGNLLAFHSYSALRSFKNGLTFFNENGEEVCFLHEIEKSTNIPSDISKIFMEYKNLTQKYTNLLAKNKELESQSKKGLSEEDIKGIKKNTFMDISNELGSSFKYLIQCAKALEQKKEKSDLEKSIVQNINNVRQTMIKLTKKYKELD